MVVRLRLARHHFTRNRPKYDIVAINDYQRTTAAPLETLGRYDPMRTESLPRPVDPVTGKVRGPEWGPAQASRQERIASGKKRVEWNEERIKYWLSIGAKPTKTVERLLNLGGILKSEWRPLPTINMKQNQLSKDERLRRAVREAEKEWHKQQPSQSNASASSASS